MKANFGPVATGIQPRSKAVQKLNRFQYPVLLTAADEGGYVVTCRDLPQLVTQGETVQDALEQASDAMDEVFATYLIEGIDFPAPSKARRREHLVSPPAETVAKAALYVVMRKAGITKIQLARRLGVAQLVTSKSSEPVMRSQYETDA
jgi:antitoxin HicB